MTTEKARKAMLENASKRKIEYSSNPNKCFECNSSLTYEKKSNKFCSSSCSVSYTNKQRGKKRYCEYCGKELNRSKTVKNSKYCSLECFFASTNRKVEEKIEKGEQVSSDSLRKYLMKKQNEKCSTCGWGERNPISKTVCLDLHHKDGNAENNIIGNVELICPNCHSLTENYKRVGNNLGSVRNRDKKG